MSSLELIATATFGLEAVVARELNALGYEAEIIQPGRVLFVGDESALCRANLWLRCADRVLLRLGAFEAGDFGVLFDRTCALPWEQWIPADGVFPVRGRSIKSQLSSVPACQRIVKKAIAEKLLAAHGTASLPETGALYPIDVALLDDVATLTLDTTGAGLNKRGYRPIAGPAPLKETLAAALVLLSFWKPDRPLVDPFCGAGTIPIEAAMIGRNLAPGVNRPFAAEDWAAPAAALWEAARTEARDAALPSLPVRILGTDAAEAALKLARFHAEKAGVAEDIHFQQGDFADLTSRREYGCLICNPPYGERMGDREQVRDLYRSMPDVLRRLQTWSHYILTADPGFETLVGRPADRRRKLFNGRIECTYYQFHGPRPPRRGAARREAPAEPQQAFGGISDKAREQADIFRNRLDKRARHLRKWPARGITCYRLYDRDIPEVPLVVDRYGDCLHLAEYDRPHDRTPAEHGDWLDLMARTAGETLGVAPADVFLKRRSRQRGDSQYERVAEAGRTLDVTEGGLTFRVNLSDYLDTGLFLDHRITRSMVREAARGKRMLNLFAYTGSFSVYAADGGATSTTTVDLSKTYLDWARENMAANDFTGRSHHFSRTDAMTFLREHRTYRAFDLAVVDPPTFSNSKSLRTDWDIQRDHAALLNRLMELMTPGGVIFFSTNFRRFKLDESALPGATIHDITPQTIPDDFRNQRIHRCWKMVTASE